MQGNMLVIGGLLATFSLTANAASLRCENGIASTGSRSSEVLLKCGEPLSKSVIGYVYNKQDQREVPQEEWVYAPAGGMQYFLLIEGGVLTRINSKRGG